MPQVQMTDRWCAKAKAAQRTEFFDANSRGLSLVVAPTGGKSWFCHYTAGGKRARMKLGTYPECSLAKAREKARRARADVGEGINPAAEKRARAASQTVADLVENYIARHASTKRTAVEIARRLRRDVVPRIGDVKLAELHRRDLTRVVDAVVDRGAEIAALRVYEDLRSMIRWARSRGDLDVNVADGMMRPTKPRVRERVLDADEIRTLWRRLDDAPISAAAARIIKLCLATGQRVGEVAGMTADELDLEAAVWRLPAARTKNATPHSVPLSRLARDLIAEQMAANAALAKRKGRPAEPWVFPAPGGGAAVGAHSISTAVRRSQEHIGIAAWTAHDLRRSMATHCEEIGISPHIVGHLLNHLGTTKATVTSAVYARYSYAGEKREALDAWAERLAAIVQGEAAAIVALRRAS